jgi:hypothetical protein
MPLRRPFTVVAGANGVVIITTKKGSRGTQSQPTKVSSVSSEVIKKYDVLQAGEFAEIVNARATAVGFWLSRSQAAQVAQFKAKWRHRLAGVLCIAEWAVANNTRSHFRVVVKKRPFWFRETISNQKWYRQ